MSYPTLAIIAGGIVIALLWVCSQSPISRYERDHRRFRKFQKRQEREEAPTPPDDHE